jgi:hypothetical protein
VTGGAAGPEGAGPGGPPGAAPGEDGPAAGVVGGIAVGAPCGALDGSALARPWLSDCGGEAGLEHAASTPAHRAATAAAAAGRGRRAGRLRRG